MCYCIVTFNVAYLRINCKHFFAIGGENLVNRIKTLAKDRGLTILQVEELCNIGKKSIYNWDTSQPAVDKVKRVADLLGVTVDELLKEE